ncbi:MAG: transcriptional regulator [Chitinophagales bacterium]
MLKIIKTKKGYEAALARAYALLQKDLKKGSDEENELEILVLLIQKYEAEKYPIPAPNPIEAIKFRMEQLGISEAEFSKIIGFRSRKSELFSGARKLNLNMIRKLHEALHIPAEVLIQEY